MNKSLLTSSALLALLVCAPVAMAQTQPKGAEEKAAPSQAPSAPATGEQKAEPKAASPDASQSAPKNGQSAPKGNTAQSEPKEKATKGNAQNKSDPQEKSNKGTAQKEGEPKDKATKGTAQNKSEPKDKSTAEKQGEPKTKSSQDTTTKTGQPSPTAQSGKNEAPGGTTRTDQAAGAQTNNGGGARIQVSEQQRTNVHQSLLREKNINRVGKVNISINIGTRVPRSIRLAAIPASIITIVPEYRSYRYFVVDDDICIVEPNSFEIVDVIRISGSTTAQRDNRNTVAFVLNDDERAIILREIEIRPDRTLGLGALSEGADVPRSVKLQAFPEAIVQRVPKLKGYEYFSAEDRIAIVEPQTFKVRMVIQARR